MTRLRLVVAAAVVAALAAAAPAQAAPKLTATVGPGFTITLTASGKKVTSLKAGRYTVVVRDRSEDHNFRLRGPVSRSLTSVPFTGTKTVTLTLKRGTYTYVCDPHVSSMKGTFRVR